MAVEQSEEHVAADLPDPAGMPGPFHRFGDVLDPGFTGLTTAQVIAALLPSTTTPLRRVAHPPRAPAPMVSPVMVPEEEKHSP